MDKVLFRFYEELNDYLPSGQSKRDFEVSLEGKKTAREMIEKLGVPVAEVDLLLVDGRSVGFDHILQTGDRISVYPVFESLNIAGASRLRDKPLRRLKFIADTDLKRLAESLEVLGFDVYFNGDLSREQILHIVKNEGRILLTRQARLMDSETIDRMIVVKGGPPCEQVNRVIHGLDLQERRR